MMKRIYAIIKRDLHSSIRDFILVYMMFAPIILAIGLMFFIPSTQSASLEFAVHENLGQEAIDIFNKYGNVETFPTLKDIKKRVNNIDDVAGINKEDGRYQLILEGNEGHDTEEISKKIIRNIVLGDKVNIDYIVNDIGIKMTPLALIGSISLLLMAIMIGGVVIGFNIIEEKESNTIKALNVTPMNRLEFIIGKSFIGTILPILQVFLILRILGIRDYDVVMVLAMTIVSSLLSIIIGFLIGVISSNQIAGIANLKIIFTILSLAIVGAVLLPQSKHFLLYWAPPYWSFMGFRHIILKDVTWSQLGIYMTWIVGLTLLIFIFFKRKLQKGLN